MQRREVAASLVEGSKLRYMGHPSYQRYSSGFLRFLLGFILGGVVRLRTNPRDGNTPGDRLFRARESWQGTRPEDEEEAEEEP